MNKKDLKRAGNNLLHGEGLIVTFLRSTVSSQIASWTDMATRMLMFAFVFSSLDFLYRSNLSVAVGAIVGGIVNCTINYKFTFQASGQSIKAVGVKYFMVWTGSLLLNMYGTSLAGIGLSKWPWLLSLGFTPDGIFAASTLLVSLIVSLAWNFVLQKNFVYRPSKFDPTAIKIVNFFLPQKNGKE